jgi:transcriptional regulator with XRE-family HTH domain
MLQGSRLLREWRQAKKLSHAQAGKLLECSASGLWDWERGACPKVVIIQRIEDKTDGAVPAASWTIEEPDEAEASPLPAA